MEIVDDDQIEAGLGLQATGLRSQLHRGDAGCVVDVDGRLGEGIHGWGESREVHLFEEPRPQPLRIHVGDRRQETQDELLLAHFQAEDSNALLLADSGVFRDIQREARLADGRPGRDEDEVGVLQAGGERVEIREARPDTAHLASVSVQVVEPVVGRYEQFA